MYSDQSESSQVKEEDMTERKKTATNNDIDTERKESITTNKKASVDSSNHIYGTQQYPVDPETESAAHYDTSSYCANPERQTDDTTEVADLQQTCMLLFHAGLFRFDRFD